MSISSLLVRARTLAAKRVCSFTAEQCVLFFSLCDGTKPATVLRAAGVDFAKAWQVGEALCLQEIQQRKFAVIWLRVDWPTSVEPVTWEGLARRLGRVKRNYFRFGLAFDAAFEFALLESELNANAMLYPMTDHPAASLHERNFRHYVEKRFGKKAALDLAPRRTVYLFAHEGIFVTNDGSLASLPGGCEIVLPGPESTRSIWRHPSCLNSGRRQLNRLRTGQVLALIEQGAGFLARQVNPDGQFNYGYFPCFGRSIPTYNSLRHASSIYSMLEAWELTRDEKLIEAIRRALGYLETTLIRHYPQSNGSTPAYTVDTITSEIKLGANGVSLLALVKYDELTGDARYRSLMERLALGILRMQDPDSGRFVHVLNAEDLSVKQAFRIIYYDGEAVFGLLRLYGLTQDARWLATAERAFDSFLRSDHWRHHDHWLAYAANELTRHRPEEKYFRFGVRNIAGHLDFILQRETTYPTLLELAMAFLDMLRRIESDHPDMRPVLKELDRDKLIRALNHRAHYLLNGFFWPELAMYFAQPNILVGSFFIRHHAFRVRIDDVEHYISGYAAYLKMLQDQAGYHVLGMPVARAPDPAPLAGIPGPPLVSVPPASPHEGALQVDHAAVGLLMYPSQPRGFLEVNTYARKAADSGVSVVYFSYRAMMISAGRIQGYRYESGRWRHGWHPLPAVIDNAPPRTSDENQWFNHLSSFAYLTCHKLGGKEITTSRLAEDSRTREYVIPSAPLTMANVQAFLESEDAVVVKPYRSNRGRNVFLLRRFTDGRVEMTTNDEQRLLDVEAFEEFVAGRASGTWMVQSYVASIDAQGRAFDVRLPIFRGANGAWHVARAYARRGANPVTSNLATGGRAEDAAAFLADIHSEQKAEEIVNRLAASASQVAEVLQETYPFVIDALGCDYGIADGNIYLFEVNPYPGIKGCLEEATDIKLAFHRSLLDVLRHCPGQPPRGVAEWCRALSQPGVDRCAPSAETELSSPRTPPIEAATERNQALLRRIMERGENDFSRSPFLKKGRGNPVYAVISHEARQRGWRMKIHANTHVEIWDDDGLLAVFSPNSPNLSLATRRMANNKQRTRHVLSRAGVPTPSGRVFTDRDQALEYFLARQGPQVVKPVSGSGGKGVMAGIRDEAAFVAAWNAVSAYRKKIIVEDFVVGDEVRLMVLGGELIAAVCRLPAYVIGDGRRSIRELVAQKNLQRRDNPLLRVYPLKSFDFLTRLSRRSLDDIPKQGEYVRLASASNVGRGGEVVSLMHDLHPSFHELARKAFFALPGATQLGLDVIARDFTADAVADNAVVIEVNCDPGIGTPRFAAFGPPAEKIAAKLLDFTARQAEEKRARETHSTAPKIVPAPPCTPACRGGSFPRGFAEQVRILRRAAHARGFEVDIVDADLTIIRSAGQRRLFYKGMPDGLLSATYRATREWAWSRRLLTQAGINTPRGDIFASEAMNEAWAFAGELGLPVVVKPGAVLNGKGISSHVRDRKHFEIAWKYAGSGKNPKIIVETCHEGNDYRLVVAGQSLVAAARRIPAHVTGDGEHSIEELVALNNARRTANPYHCARPLVLTPPILLHLRNMELTPATVLPKGRRIMLQLAANIESGVECVDVVDQVHPGWAERAVAARRAVYDPPHVGLDLVAEDIRLPPDQQRWVITAVNADPDLGIHHFPMRGKPRDVAGTVLDHLFGPGKAPQQAAVLLTIRGKVQGVGYRQWAWKAAHLRGLRGWVRNREDGAVAILVAGSSVAVHDVEARLRVGPRKCKVTHVDTEPWTGTIPDGFEIVH
ncbi:YheC/YheD family protein [Desulfonatronum thioautotrophicum]|uniref:YheC/YheD family protein n=1 Tax=Desulfonatronum thioautotrophicum TaxID=617001 RepID=UPI000699FC8C|nr:YheC/YheD family protein [Desulfonatronum thioautotrophicum]